METVTKTKGTAGTLAEEGSRIAALIIVVEVLGLGNISLSAAVSVVSNVSGMLSTLGAEGLMGLIAIWVLYAIWQRK